MRRKLKRKKRIGALLLATALILAQLGTTAYAGEPHSMVGAVSAPSGEAAGHTAEKVDTATDSNAEQAPPLDGNTQLPDGDTPPQDSKSPPPDYGMALRENRSGTGDFTVTGGTPGTDYTYADNTLTILTGTALTIRNIDPSTPTQNKIVVKSGVTANITLAGVNIDVYYTVRACAFDITGATVALTLAEGTDNILKSGDGRAGLSAPGIPHSTLVIDGDGALTAMGRADGAGIGGYRGSDGGNITIRGNVTVTAKGGDMGAGIGGSGLWSSGGVITITENAKVIASSRGGAGIGGGWSDIGPGGDGGQITISGSAQVWATSTDGGAGIGGGDGFSSIGSGGQITISGGTVTATATGIYDDGNGVGIGGGGGEVHISGADTVVTAKGGGTDVAGDLLSVTDEAILKMESKGADVDTLEYKNCTITDKDGNSTYYDQNGDVIDVNAKKPTITNQPQGGTYSQGASAVLTVTASVGDSGALSYQWYSNTTNSSTGGTEIPGATSDSYSAPTNTTGTKYYYVVVTNTRDDATGQKTAMVTSDTAAVTVNTLTNAQKPTITEQPQGGTYLQDDSAVLTVAASVTGNGALSYQWYSNTTNSTTGGASITGATLAGYSAPTDTTGTKYYYVVITNTKDDATGQKTAMVTSDTAMVTVNPLTNAQKPTITEQPQGGTYLQGDGAVLTVAASVTDNGTLSYQWYSSATDSNTGGTEIPGATSAGYGAPTDATGTKYYYVLVTNTKDDATGQKTATVTSNAVAVTVNPLINAEMPDITQQPQSGSYVQNEIATLTVAASVTDNGTLSYQWYSSATNSNTGGTEIPGATSDSYGAPTGTTGTIYYYIVVTNTNNRATGQITATATSNVAAVTVTGNSSGGNVGGGGGGGGGGTYTPPATKDSYTSGGNQVGQSVSRSDLQRLTDSGKSLTVQSDAVKMTFDPAALNAILAAVPATAGNITFTAAPADLSAFPDAAKQIGAHPVYDFTISYKDGSGNLVTVPVNFPAGSAAITLNYAPAASEVTGSLFMVYVDGKGAVTWLDKSSYQVNGGEADKEGGPGRDNGKVLAEVPHFSTYGVAYKMPDPAFTDISGHWAKEDIDFVAARGLLSGTGNNQFSPDTAMTRGMFVTALGRLAGVDVNGYQYTNFTDVSADAYYSPYISWAVQQGIVNGTGDQLFSPDAPMTREQMAVMLVSYAGQMGEPIPAPLAENTFADSDKISSWAVKEVTVMQRAGIMRGKDGNIFDPQADATRAEASAALHRLVEILIDPAAATGWVKNDSGHWLYYQDGKALTGWQTIGGLHYYFNPDGVMHEGWKQDEATGNWYYWTNAGAATGWREIGGKRYYFDENGVMAADTTIDGYEVGPDGARLPG